MIAATAASEMIKNQMGAASYSSTDAFALLVKSHEGASANKRDLKKEAMEPEPFSNSSAMWHLRWLISYT